MFYASAFLLRRAAGRESFAGLAQCFCAGNRQAAASAQRQIVNDFDPDQFRVSLQSGKARNWREAARKVGMTSDEVKFV